MKHSKDTPMPPAADGLAGGLTAQGPVSTVTPPPNPFDPPPGSFGASRQGPRPAAPTATAVRSATPAPTYPQPMYPPPAGHGGGGRRSAGPARRPRRRIGWIVALVLVPLGGIGGLGAHLLGTMAERDDDGRVTESGQVMIDDLRTGDCLEEQSVVGEEVTQVPVTPCANPHWAEVFQDFELPNGAYPGDEEVFRLSEEGCLAQFTPWVGVPYEQSSLQFMYYPPARATWSQDRSVSCLIVLPAPEAGSLQGTRR